MGRCPVGRPTYFAPNFGRAREVSTPEWVPKTEQPIVGGPTYVAQNGAGATIGAQVSVRLKFGPDYFILLKFRPRNLILLKFCTKPTWPTHKVAHPIVGASPAALAQNGTIIKSSTNCESATSSRASASLPHAALPPSPSGPASATNRTHPPPPLCVGAGWCLYPLPDDDNI